MYCPIIPILKSCIAPIKIIAHIVDAHPATGSPKHTLLIIMISIIINAINVIPIPLHDAILRGTSEKLIIPSIAYLNNFQKFHFVSPATRSTFL